MLRIVAGKWRGRKLSTVPGQRLRPTADRVKESIYNVLQAVTAGARVLDLYAGSGSLGLEALSRGARRAVMVERDAAALAVLQRNVEMLGARGEVEVVRADALRWLQRVPFEPFDLILADPPYAAGAEDALLAAAGAALRAGGCFVLQHGKHWTAPASGRGLRRWQSKRYGDTGVDFFVREGEEHGRPVETDGAVSGDV